MTTMKLLTQAIRAALPPLYSQDGKGEDAVAHLKLFCASWTWFATEFDGHDTFFGLVISHICPEGELGYFSLSELQNAKGPMGLGVERDLHWKPKMLAEARAELCRMMGI